MLFFYVLQIANIAVNQAFAAVLYALFRSPLCKYGWFQCWNDQADQQALQYPFAGCKKFGQTNGGNYAEKLLTDPLLHFYTNSLAFSRCCCGQAAFRF